MQKNLVKNKQKKSLISNQLKQSEIFLKKKKKFFLFLINKGKICIN
jgi:hypothetical protein